MQSAGWRLARGEIGCLSMRRDPGLFVYGTLLKPVNHPMHQVLARHAAFINMGAFQGRLCEESRLILFPTLFLPWRLDAKATVLYDFVGKDT